ncbi:MAG: amidohydrolase [Spartobacteria bacterium]|nr:amidohydrolase [Spartobacteria bacterium]
MHIVDFHAHAFPDSLAEKAMTALQDGCDVPAVLDGRTDSLLHSMDEAGIEKAVICSIATRPKQFRPILDWSVKTASDRLVMLPSVHPASENVIEELRIIKEEGFKGIKVHPYYQEFKLDDECMYPIYETLSELGLMFVSHTGYDIAFPRYTCADPERVARVVRHHPDLVFVATHFGGWEDWDNVEKFLLGKEIYIETSFAFFYMPPERVRSLVERHPPDRLLFGTDTPWRDQKEDLAQWYALHLPDDLLQKILGQNAENLLNRLG